MYLKRLEIQGFKTFAQKTSLEFTLSASGRRGLTAVVGPNGSGKSNIADAIRWVMGEQSLKLLRGKRSEDVIFSGSEKRSRSGFAEVTLVLERTEEDERKSEDDFNLAEVSVTRRLYRDGQSEYEVNRQTARLTDVVMLLAQCGIGQRTYSVIGQGMIDSVLVASPTERKEFFDEAFGLRPFQLKRNQAMNKIDESKKNLVQTETLLREIEPRLHSLERQMKRLQERAGVEEELRALSRVYYGHEWKQLSNALNDLQTRLKTSQTEEAVRENEARLLEAELTKMEQATPVGEGFKQLREALDGLATERAALRERQLRLETERAVAAVRAEKPWAPLPLSKIIETIDGLAKKHEELEKILATDKLDLAKLRILVNDLRSTSDELVNKLQRPAPEPEKVAPKDAKHEQELADIAKLMADVAARTMKAQSDIENWNSAEEGKRKHIFETQHQLSQKRAAAQLAERKASEVSIELARVETRREAFMTDLKMHGPDLEAELPKLVADSEGAKLPADAAARLQKLRSQLEWIGGIDPETLKEHEETKTRYDFLSKQVEDLRAGLSALDTVIEELDATIRERGAKAFKDLNREFTKYFKKLFNGGDASLAELAPEPETDEEGNVLEEIPEGAVAGIEIIATPPGKRAKSIALLSGGERALTSIALICAIMATNPSPFVVLDEVDAALDESNSRNFAEIIDSLAEKTQFIVISHNRATMAQAHVLYGVTMGDDGVSQLLSVKVEDVEKLRTRG